MKLDELMDDDIGDELDEKLGQMSQNLSVEKMLSAIAKAIEKMGDGLTYAVLLNKDNKCAIASNLDGKAKLVQALELAIREIQKGDNVAEQVFKGAKKLDPPVQWLEHLASTYDK